MPTYDIETRPVLSELMVLLLKKQTTSTVSGHMCCQRAQEQGQLTAKAPGATGEDRRLLIDWKVAAGTPAMVFTITFPLTVPVGREGVRQEAGGTHLHHSTIAPLAAYPLACSSRGLRF